MALCSHISLAGVVPSWKNPGTLALNALSIVLLVRVQPHPGKAGFSALILWMYVVCTYTNLRY